MSDEEDRLPGSGVVIFRPSYSATTLNCPGSLLPSIEAPDTAGYDAAVGTVFHELLAEWQLSGRPDYLLGQFRVVEHKRKDGSVNLFEVEIDEDMFLYGQDCLQRYAVLAGERHVEVLVDISSLTPIPGQTGTSDLIVCAPGVLNVVDWKYGKGVKVFAKDNTQALCYAWGAFERFDLDYEFQTIYIHIAQPRLEHYDVWTIDRGDLLAFARFARNRWKLAWGGKGDRVPSPKACQWCKVKTGCPAKQALLEAIADDSFDVLEEVSVSPEAQRDLVYADAPVISLTAPVELDTARLAWIYQYRKSVEDWFRLIGEELLKRGIAGEDLGGLWKVGRGRDGNRAWKDEETAAEALSRLGIDEDALWSRELVSPAEVEKLLRRVGVKGKLNRQYLKMFTQRSSGRLTLMPASDSRSSIDEIVDQSFDVIE